MKRISGLLAALLLVVLCAVLLPTQAEAASTYKLTFTLNSGGKSYSVTDCYEYARGELVIPATYNGKPITSIGDFAFSHCTSLTSITIPDSVTSIGDGAFNDCTSLTGIHVSEHNSKYSGDGRGVLFNKSQTVLIAAPGRISGEYVIPNSVTSIGNYAFSDCGSLTSITIPDSVTSIGNYAFYDCRSLTSITIPDSVTSIGENAFYGCENLKFTTYGKAKYLGNANNPYLALIKASSGDITSCTIHAKTKVIAGNAFSNCDSLTSITIPDSVTSIGDSAFYSCNSLTSITIPDSVTSIGAWTFSYCGSLTSITIPDSVTSIGSRAFYNCESLTSITIPDSVTSIGDYVFYHSGICSVIFTGNAPVLEDSALTGMSAYVYYPANNSTWTAVVQTNYGGGPVWVEQTPLKITTQPKDTYTKQGATAKVTVDAQGDGLTYQWYIKNAGSTSWGKSSVTTSTYSVKMASSTKNRQVYCVITDWYGNSVKTNTVTLHMAATITKQPVSVNALVGQMATVKVTAVGDGLTYTWYQAAKGSTSFTKSTTFTGNTYSVEMSDVRDGRQVYCVITDEYGNTATTNTVTLNKATTLTITTQPKTTYTKQGATATVTVKAQGDGLKYTWYIKNASSTSWGKSSVTTNTYTVKMASTTKNRQLYCVVTDKYGNTVKSGTVYLRMAATVTKQPVNTSAYSGEKVSVTVGAAGDGLKYTWYIKNAGSSTWGKSSVTTNTYTVKMTSSTKGRQVYCVVKDKYGKTVTTNAVTLSMRTKLAITTQPKTTYTKQGATASVTVKAAGDGLKYTWYIKNAGSSSWAKSSVATNTYTVKMASTTKNRQLYCVVTDKYGNTVKTSTVYLRMMATITKQPVDTMVAEGSTAKVSVTAVGDGLTYTWYIKNAGSSSWGKSSVTTNTYSVKMANSIDGRQVYCVVKDKYGKTVTSKTVTLYME